MDDNLKSLTSELLLQKIKQFNNEPRTYSPQDVPI